ncbi:cation diffusion facilitator family transporter [Nocardioides sp. TRM66260-LWL]|uniref:cation diffusion facilitator family transporter n=1 Tax=Nocardioides sp. TRM66260-LWL TaxID=2874478 RepID=UPI001CC7DECB|nr:cation diffusion facilitator family transporter [Nocardioides sp. TRM66260-LWL]MBZ5735055.1 cation diffusion facilitator family transporter [Nocardioides sp. TRM66260-LWL]
MSHDVHSPHDHDLGHGHGHGHGHGRLGPWARLRDLGGHLLGAGHGHDAADQVDDALEADARGRRALWLSLALLGVTAAAQGAVVVLTGSVALLGDTLHNVADALTALPLLAAFALARRPANDRLTYGYGRAEDLAGVVVVLMIALSSVLAAGEAIRRLLDPRAVDHVWAVALAGVIGFAGNEVVAQYRIRVGRQIGSAALVADGLHARTDGFTSLAVVVGALGVALGAEWADPVVGLLISVAIVGVLRSAAAQVGARLMDAVDPAHVAAARAALADVDGVVAVERVRLRWVGHTLHAEARVVGATGLDLVQAGVVADEARHSLRHDLRRLGDVVVEVVPEPARRA